MSSKKIAFGWYGGKYSHLDWLLPLLPYTKHYCEPFGGSAAVLINRKPSPVETYNDIDGEVANFFRVLCEQKEELLEAIGLTPFSREELRIAVNGKTEDLTELERARRFFVRARQVRTGLAQTASEGRWAHCKLTSRAGMARYDLIGFDNRLALPEVSREHRLTSLFGFLADDHQTRKDAIQMTDDLIPQHRAHLDLASAHASQVLELMASSMAWHSCSNPVWKMSISNVGVTISPNALWMITT